MRNLLALLAALLILFGTLGWFRGWYSLGHLPAESGHFAFRVEVDGVKVGSDFADAFQYLHSKFAKEKKEEDATAKEKKEEKPAKADEHAPKAQ
jgi:hypothetical protein